MDIFLQAVMSYLVIVDPIGVALIFHAMTKEKSKKYCRRMSFRAVLISFCLVIFFGFFGDWVLHQLGISLDSFKVAGGLLLFYTAFCMVTQTDEDGLQEKQDSDNDISVFPLSIPLLAGPGCLTLTVLLFTGTRQHPQGYLLLLAALIIVYAMTLLCLLVSRSVSRIMGETGNSIMKRLLGVLLAALSIQFIADGIRGFISS
jgi:multiple antibiotic resistance protein